jgi:hypothetical protein
VGLSQAADALARVPVASLLLRRQCLLQQLPHIESPSPLSVARCRRPRRAYIRMYIHICMHACIHTYIHAYTHTQICIYIHVHVLGAAPELAAAASPVRQIVTTKNFFNKPQSSYPWPRMLWHPSQSPLVQLGRPRGSAGPLLP